MFIITLLFPQGGQEHLSWALYNVLSGGVMLGAIFMATDYASSPVTHRGQIVFGIGCGLITVFIRYFGTYSEGVCFAIIIMNCTVWPVSYTHLVGPFTGADAYRRRRASSHAV